MGQRPQMLCHCDLSDLCDVMPPTGPSSGRVGPVISSCNWTSTTDSTAAGTSDWESEIWQAVSSAPFLYHERGPVAYRPAKAAPLWIARERFFTGRMLFPSHSDEALCISCLRVHRDRDNILSSFSVELDIDSLPEKCTTLCLYSVRLQRAVECLLSLCCILTPN